MDADRIAGVRAKLDRADEHFEALTTAVRAYVDSQPNTYPIEADLSAGTYTVRIKINEFPPSRLAILCGDFIQNLRAALDHLANALVPEPSRRTGFPIFRSPQGFREKVRTPAIRGDDGLLTGLNPQGQIFAQIESLQPYHKAPAEIRTDPLACLADLSNTDKHRTILTTFSAHRHDPRQPTPDIDFDKATDVTFVGQAAFTYDKVLTDGDEVLRGEFVVTGPTRSRASRARS